MYIIYKSVLRIIKIMQPNRELEFVYFFVIASQGDELELGVTCRGWARRGPLQAGSFMSWPQLHNKLLQKIHTNFVIYGIATRWMKY
jgi:hypothetical protein